jgi:hypothetical protein
LQANSSYRITLSGVTGFDETGVEIYDPYNSIYSYCDALNPAAHTITCNVVTGGSTTYLEVDVWATTGTEDSTVLTPAEGALFTVAATTTDMANETSVELQVGAPAVAGTVSHGQSTYWAWVSGSTYYTVTLAGVTGGLSAEDVALEDGEVSGLCTGTTTIACTITTVYDANQLYLTVNGGGTDIGATYSIGVASGPTAQSGVGLAVGGNPVSGSVNLDQSTYRAATVYDGVSYTITVASLSDDAVTVFVADDRSVNTEGSQGSEGTCGTVTGHTVTCTITPSNTSSYSPRLWIFVNGSDTDVGATYTLQVAKSP